MSRPTKSEHLFRKYCADRGYDVETIPEGPEKTPDFLVSTSQGQLIAEIKELCPNEEDRKIISENGGTIRKIFGKRVGEKIKRAKRQKYGSSSIPQVIVLYDNITIGDIRPTYPNFYLSPVDIAFGMYGELKTSILFDKATGKMAGTKSELGKNQFLRSDEGKEISAVCILCDVLENAAPFMHTFHSVFATMPLSRKVFSGPNDKHFQNPIHGNVFETSWIEF